jgi:hypothetical protein
MMRPTDHDRRLQRWLNYHPHEHALAAFILNASGPSGFESPVAYGKALRSVWTRSERIGGMFHDDEQFQRLMRAMWGHNPTQSVMSHAERRRRRELPQQVVVYRGGDFRQVERGWSWTLSFERAKWFARRFAPTSPSIVVGECHRNDILALITERNEDEVVVDPEDVAVKLVGKYLVAIPESDLDRVVRMVRHFGSSSLFSGEASEL